MIIASVLNPTVSWLPSKAHSEDGVGVAPYGMAEAAP
jgi:hypothetical protein